ncbi:hypothetical protein EYR40_008665 [Pleurotus pulmonarius]|nr:hypothetical protein EYR40_008665 [Pleurotus pulmonarius]
MNSPASSVSSILLAELPWGDNSLLDETLTLDTLSDSYSLSSNSPAINQGVLESTPKPINSFRKQNIYASRPLAKRVTPAATVGIGAPAQPNAQEGLSVKDWAQSLVPSDPPDHVPWGDGEGNTYVISDDAQGGFRAPHILVKNPPSPFRARHDGPHLKVPKDGSPSDSYLRSTAPLTIRRDRKRDRAPTNRPINELVFEREISLPPGSGGRPERLSLQIPATTMSPELVDLMLELHNLKTFFQEPGGEKAPASKPPHRSPRSQAQEDTKAPTLILSDSHSVFPIPLSRPGSDASLKGLLSASKNPDTSGTTPIAIAARRGRKMLAPLAVQSNAIGDNSDIMYPGMPTAFLGTPSAYSPHSGMPLLGPTGSCAPPAPPNGLDIQGMIESLRGQCAAFPATPNTPNYPTQTPSEPLPPLPSDTKAQPEKRKRRRVSETTNPKRYRPRQGGPMTRNDTLASLSAGLDACGTDSSNIYFGQDLAKSTASFNAVKSSRSSHWDLENVTRPKILSSGRASLSTVSPMCPPSPTQQQKNRRRTMAIVGGDRIGEWAASQNFSEDPPSPSKDPDVPRSALRHTSSPPADKPSHQSRASSVSSTYAPRGILRNRKSVRFASLPGRKSNSIECAPRPRIDHIGHQDQTQDRRRGGRASLPTPSSALERKSGREVNDFAQNTTSSVPSQPPTSLSSKSRNSATSDTQKLITRRRHTFTPTPELRSQPTSNAAQGSSRTRNDRSVSITSPTPTKHRPPPVVRSTRTTTITPRKSIMTIEEQMPIMRQTGSQLSPQKTARLCRKSMASTNDPDHRSHDKENRGVGRASLGYAPSPVSFHNGGNQTAGRKERSMSVDDYDSKGSKGKGASRMPVPLRNILTRFK